MEDKSELISPLSMLPEKLHYDSRVDLTLLNS